MWQQAANCLHRDCDDIGSLTPPTQHCARGRTRGSDNPFRNQRQVPRIRQPNLETKFEFNQEPTPQSVYSYPILTWEVFKLTKRHPINNDSILSNACFFSPYGRGQQTVAHPSRRSVPASRFAPPFRAADVPAASRHTGATHSRSPIQGR